ncbi:MAG: N-acetyl-gamma-glutamyl-phosphate reductase [Oscillospiraceae bacterium]|nr:N-acetyl-gamma-glutamyl-phosphate reductase [Oscillospiraceae bacterium]
MDVVVIGATGYVGLEIVRLLSRHPTIRLAALASQSHVGRRVSDVYPSLRKVNDSVLVGPEPDGLLGLGDTFVTALPDGASQELVPALLAGGGKVLDHSGSFRFKDAAVYGAWYGAEHKAPSLLGQAAYGLPELHRAEIARARLVANPGCYPTCALLALAPALAARAVDPDRIIIDAVSGVSGAGRKAEVGYLFTELDGNFKPYGVCSHRHTPEIEQGLSALAGRPVTVTFTPHLAPMKRGMSATVYADLGEGFGALDGRGLREMVAAHYEGEYFVRVCEYGTFPETSNVAGSNFADIGVDVDRRTGRAILVSAIDNLAKGAASQAVQSLNVMAGLPESAGLDGPGWRI